jgi:hypothetical protein
MRGTAQRPGDARPDLGARPGQDPEGAAFTVSRVGGRRHWSAVFLLGFAVVLGGVIAVGAGFRSPTNTSILPLVPLDSPTVVPAWGGATLPTLPRLQLPAPTMGPPSTSGPGPIQLEASRRAESMFVHGDVFVPNVTWVFVSLQRAVDVIGWASVSVPGGAGPGVGSGPTLRFDVELPIPSVTVIGPLTIQATAYDRTGKLVASARLAVGAVGGGAPEPTTGALVPAMLIAPTVDVDTVTSSILDVAGELRVKAEWVRVGLESGDGRQLVSELVATADPNGGIRPVRTPTFDVSLRIPSPRPTGLAWIVVTAFDDAGVPLGAMRRPILIEMPAG